MSNPLQGKRQVTRAERSERSRMPTAPTASSPTVSQLAAPFITLKLWFMSGSRASAVPGPHPARHRSLCGKCRGWGACAVARASDASERLGVHRGGGVDGVDLAVATEVAVQAELRRPVL